MGTRTDARLPFDSISPEFLKPRDPVLGYVKIGGKESTPRFARGSGKPWLAPVRFVDPPRFEVTTREKVVKSIEGQGKAKGERFNVDYGYKRDVGYHERIDEKAPTALRVRLMYPTPAENIVAFLGAYGSGSWACRGDGVTAIDATRGECVCPCPRLQQFEGTYEGQAPRDKLQCRPHGQLNLLLEDAEVFGGFWAFKTTSFESISNILHVLQTMERTFHRVDGLPFELRVMAATKSFGGGMTTQPIVTLVLAASMDTARQIASDAAASSQRYLPVGVPEAEAYREAVLEEMEEEAESTAGEFSDEATLEARADEEEPVDQGPDFEVVSEDDELELEGSDVDETEKERAGARAEASADDALPPATPATPPPAETAGPPEPTELEVLEQLCRDVLEAAGYDADAIEGRVGYHKGKGELEKLRAGLELHCADAYRKVVTEPELDLEAASGGPPDDGLEI